MEGEDLSPQLNHFQSAEHVEVFVGLNSDFQLSRKLKSFTIRLKWLHQTSKLHLNVHGDGENTHAYTKGRSRAPVTPVHVLIPKLLVTSVIILNKIRKETRTSGL